MDFNVLVDEIVARVSAQMSDMPGECTAAPCGNDERPKLLILTQDHGLHCHQMLESDRLTARYATVCALTEEYACDLGKFEAVILYDLNLATLVKIADGNGDAPYTGLAIRAILSGKKIFAVREDVELFDYEGTAPAAYYQALLGKVEFLQQAGVKLVNRCNLEAAILDEPCAPVQNRQACTRPKKVVIIDKKVISERDVSTTYSDGATEIHVSAKTIITDLAKEYANAHNLPIVKT